MSFRSRVAGLVALAVAGAFLLASLVMFGATRRSLLSAVDTQLRQAVQSGPGERPGAQLVDLRRLLEPDGGSGGRIAGTRGARNFEGPVGDALRGVGVVQLIRLDGEILATLPDQLEALPFAQGDLREALASGRSSIVTVGADGATYRSVLARVGNQLVMQVARPIDDIEEGLRGLAVQLALVSLAGIGLAFVAGRLVAERILRPVRQLTTTAELIAETQELAHRAEVTGDDELSRLGVALNRMLTALDSSRKAQHQLVADASHELRTPLTSLRTNVELLGSQDALTSQDRAAMRADVIGQIEEMTMLISNLVDLARDGSDRAPATAIDLEELVTDCVERQRRLTPQASLELTAAQTHVLGEADRVRHAVANLLDNAVKYGAGSLIEVEVADGRVVVRDNGPGIPGAQQPHVFERFWRSPAARGAPGSGLGLAIVEQVAQSHGGTIVVDDAPGGGARFVLTLPTATPDPTAA